MSRPQPTLARRLVGGAIVFLAGTGVGCPGLAAAPARPNILLLFADDMRADSIAALGNPAVKTPNLDRLVREGFVLRNAYCLGGNIAAVCTPSRNMLLSGNAYFRWKDYTPPGLAGRKGLLAPGDGPNLPLSLKQAGYLTYHHGKRGNTATLIQACFEINKYLTSDLADRTHGEPGREIIDEAIAFLKQRTGDRPFFMYLAFANPHDPRVAAKHYMDLYQRDLIPLPRNFLPMHPFDNGEMTVRDERLLPWPRTEADIRRTLHEYYATISGLDFHIGRLLQALEELGELDQTIVIFSADQGIAVGSHGLLGKQSLYEAAMKVPLVLRGPGIRRGSSDALVYLLDLYPTLCELVGALEPAGIDGVSFKPVLDGKAKTIRQELFLSYTNVQRAVRDERWKLIRYPLVDRTQLFDLQSDPDEMHDLAGQPGHADRVERMLARLKVLQARFGDDAPLSVAEPRPAAWTPPAEQPKKRQTPRKAAQRGG
ncbi:MAG: sulfatase-like hydrolase/transferase [Thermoguttaceae bacterium]